MVAQRFHRRIALDLAARQTTARVKTGVSVTRRRTKMPTRIRTKLARNGRRQPQLISSSCGSIVTRANAPAASRLPTETPSGAKPPQKPRWLRGRVLDQIDHRAAIFGAGAKPLYDRASRPAGCGPNTPI